MSFTTIIPEWIAYAIRETKAGRMCPACQLPYKFYDGTIAMICHCAPPRPAGLGPCAYLDEVESARG